MFIGLVIERPEEHASHDGAECSLKLTECSTKLTKCSLKLTECSLNLHEKGPYEGLHPPLVVVTVVIERPEEHASHDGAHHDAHKQKLVPQLHLHRSLANQPQKQRE